MRRYVQGSAHGCPGGERGRTVGCARKETSAKDKREHGTEGRPTTCRRYGHEAHERFRNTRQAHYRQSREKSSKHKQKQSKRRGSMAPRNQGKRDGILSTASRKGLRSHYCSPQRQQVGGHGPVATRGRLRMPGRRGQAWPPVAHARQWQWAT